MVTGTECSGSHQSYNQAQSLDSVVKCIRNVPKQITGITLE